MAKWRIAWTQEVGDAGALHHVDEVRAVNASLALAQWGRMSYCNARVDAVWRVGCEKVLQDAIGEGGARGCGEDVEDSKRTAKRSW